MLTIIDLVLLCVIVAPTIFCFLNKYRLSYFNYNKPRYREPKIKLSHERSILKSDRKVAKKIRKAFKFHNVYGIIRPLYRLMEAYNLDSYTWKDKKRPAEISEDKLIVFGENDTEIILLLITHHILFNEPVKIKNLKSYILETDTFTRRRVYNFILCMLDTKPLYLNIDESLSNDMSYLTEI